MMIWGFFLAVVCTNWILHPVELHGFVDNPMFAEVTITLLVANTLNASWSRLELDDFLPFFFC